ncbi:MAG: polyprenyl diphosphate synthase [Bacteroidales bacterium]|nr:polyprenyl diphosphate synthase [Bacteroidales bacterium]
MNPVPVHVSIIMDGNGRWAAGRGLERLKGHVKGVDSVRAVAEAAVGAGVKYLSLFAFSEENWGRPEAEVGGVMKLMAKSLESEFGLFVEHGIRLLVLGNRSRIGRELDAQIARVEKATASNTTMTLILFLSYSGRWDILQAAAKLVSRGEPVTEEFLAGSLVTAGIPDPDLIIRTSGEKRLSNYMLWQSAYSEFVFTDTLWPDFGKDEFALALREYSGRERRFGKVK